MTHNIKLEIKFCDAVLNGKKTFEVRKNDRNYKRGDLIKFVPVTSGFHIPLEHPIMNKTYEITYVLSGWGIEKGFCVFSIKKHRSSLRSLLIKMLSEAESEVHENDLHN